MGDVIVLMQLLGDVIVLTVIGWRFSGSKTL